MVFINNQKGTRMILFHNSIRKYTLAMLETFNGLKVEYNRNGVLAYRKVPIKYATREKLTLLDEADQNSILSGNFSVLPRSSLTLSSTTRNFERQSNKFVKLAIGDFGEFIFNATAYDFNFDMTIMCRGMNEASSLVEQIASRFNPNYTILINEIPNQQVPTSVPIQLVEVNLEGDVFEEMSANIVLVTASFVLKGNFYQPLEIQKQIKYVDMYMDMWYSTIQNDYNRAKKFGYDVIENRTVLDDEISLFEDGRFANIPPVILDIIGGDSIEVGKTLDLVCQWRDDDNKKEELTFTWYVNGNATITSNTDTAKLVGNSTEIVEVFCIITDVHNNTSNLFTKQVTVL